MTHQDNLKTVIDACIAANPEIAEPKFGCLIFTKDRGGLRIQAPHLHDAPGTVRTCYGTYNLCDVEVIGRPITAADVLFALGRNYAFDGEGWLFEWGRGEWSYDLDTIKLDLRLPLSGWSKEAVAYLASILGKNA